MAKPLKIINVPKPEPGWYNPNRPVGVLIRAQTSQLREALLLHLQEVVSLLAIDPKSLKTEGDVDSYIYRATALLHTHSRTAART